jgi:hypothetical protein
MMAQNGGSRPAAGPGDIETGIRVATSGRITTHYSAPEISNLVAAVNRIADSRGIHAKTVLRLVA